MTKEQKTFQDLTATAQKTTEQAIEKAQGAVENYFDWLQTTISSSPLGNTDVYRILVHNTTQNIAAAFDFTQKFSQVKNLEDAIKLQSEFLEKQVNSFNEQTKNLSEICTKALAGAVKSSPLHLSR